MSGDTLGRHNWGRGSSSNAGQRPTDRTAPSPTTATIGPKAQECRALALAKKQEGCPEEDADSPSEGF